MVSEDSTVDEGHTRKDRHPHDPLFLGVALEYPISKRNATTDVRHTLPEYVEDFVTPESKMVIRGKDFESDRFDDLRSDP